MTKSKQETGFKKTLRNMLRGKPATNKDVADRQKSPAYLRKMAEDLGMTDPNEDFGSWKKRKKR